MRFFAGQSNRIPKKMGAFWIFKTDSKGKKIVCFEVVESDSASGLGFDPEAFSKAGNATCPFCSAVVDSDYVKREACAARMDIQPMAILATRNGEEGKVYLAPQDTPQSWPDKETIHKRIEDLCKRSGLTIPDEAIEANPRSMDTQHFGFQVWADLFTYRQNLSLLSFAAMIREAGKLMQNSGVNDERRIAVCTFLACNLDKQADRNSQLCVILADGGRGIKNSFARQAIPMTWDFAEANPFNPIIASWKSCFKEVLNNIRDLSFSNPACVVRGSAMSLPWEESKFDAIITDPPYYDNVSYSNLSDFFYVWLKRSVGNIYPEHFASEGTPKKNEIIAAFYRHGGSKDKSRQSYEDMMARAFSEAHRVLKPDGQFVVVYAHKTTLGWATLVGAMRIAGFTVTEAWPLDTESKGRMVAQGTAALASSIFLVARKRDGAKTGDHDNHVRPELESIVRERVETLWDMGISGADLVIASVGAGLRAFTRFARVEYANGEEVPAERFLTEVETVVLETILTRLSKEVGGNGGQYSLASLDTASRFYVLWRYTYGAAELDAGEAIIFANGTHVELDGQHGLAGGNHAMIEKRKSKYRLRDYAERGENDKLGLPSESGQAAPLVDMLHRTLWLMEKRPAELATFLSEAQPNREQLRLVAQALGGPALKGGEMGDISPTAELSALGKLTANWQSLIENAAMTPGEREEKKVGQKQLI
jgi:putative DNA methylase